MAEYSTVARPYAKAVFQVAEASNTFDDWSASLAVWSQVAENEQVRKLFHDPKVKSEQLIGLFEAVKKTNEHGRRFLNMLSEAKRFEALPDVKRIYENLLAERQQLVHAEVFVAEELTQDQQERLQNALSKRFNQDVELEVKIDKQLIAGARIRVGDQVWDASLRQRLARFSENLLS